MSNTKSQVRKPVKNLMKLVIAVRHGRNNSDDLLTEHGQWQIELLSTRLIQLIGDRGNIKLLSSHATRAEQTAIIIGKRLGLAYEICPMLICDFYSGGKDLMDHFLAKHAENNVIIAVTHCNTPSGIMDAFAQSMFEKRVEDHDSKNGNGCMIDLETGEVMTDLLAGRTS